MTVVIKKRLITQVLWLSALIVIQPSQQAQVFDPVLIYRWLTVLNCGPTLNQHWVTSPVCWDRHLRTQTRASASSGGGGGGGGGGVGGD